MPADPYASLITRNTWPLSLCQSSFSTIALLDGAVPRSDAMYTIVVVFLTLVLARDLQEASEVKH